MPEIQYPQPDQPDIYSFNFARDLYKITPGVVNPLVYDQFQQINTVLLSSGEMGGQFVLTEGNLQSGNYVPATSGWRIRANGDVEFNVGNFRGTVSVGSLHIPDEDTTANSFHVDTTGNTWWGCTQTNFTADNSNALAYVLKNGKAVFAVVTTIGSSATGQGVYYDGTDITCAYSHLYFQSYFGEGSDGDVVISVNSTLTTDKFYNDLTINSGVILNPGGYRIYIKGKLTNNGTIDRSGNGGSDGVSGAPSAGTGGAGGTALSSGSIFGSTAAGAGGTGGFNSAGSAGSAGGAAAKSLVGAGGGSPGGRVSGESAGGVGGAGGAATGTVYNSPKNVPNAVRLHDDEPSLDFLRGAGGAGGAGGGGSNTGSNSRAGGGGGGGAPGGIIVIAAREIVNNGTISSNGGAGGNGGDGGSGTQGAGAGADGGRGGVIILIYNRLTTTGTLSVSGGAGGLGGSNLDASDGEAGEAGLTTIQIEI